MFLAYSHLGPLVSSWAYATREVSTPTHNLLATSGSQTAWKPPCTPSADAQTTRLSCIESKRNWMWTALFRESKLVSLLFPWADQPMEKIVETCLKSAFPCIRYDTCTNATPVFWKRGRPRFWKNVDVPAFRKLFREAFRHFWIIYSSKFLLKLHLNLHQPRVGLFLKSLEWSDPPMHQTKVTQSDPLLSDPPARC